MNNRSGKGTVVVAMSGGVDSSVAAYLLKKDGYNPIGVTFKLWCHEGSDHIDAIIHRAEKISRQLGIDHRTVDIEKEFEETVVHQFIEEYLAGITPNPCVFCNRVIKWRYLLRMAEELQAAYVATGHYVRIVKNQNSARYEIHTGLDPQKDQSYVLWQLSQEMLSKTKFPLGTLNKAEVKKLADELGLSFSEQKESQDVCFLPDNDYRGFLNRYVPRKVAAISRGELLDEQGQFLGYHDGFYNFTIGQRKGFKRGFSERKYVKQIIADKNQVIMSGNDSLFSDGMVLEGVNWVSDNSQAETDGVIKIRYNHKGVSCHVEEIKPDHLKVRFEERQRAVTPGQSGVLYRGDRLVLGGIIKKSINKLT